jgi:hypothetical protein
VRNDGAARATLVAEVCDGDLLLRARDETGAIVAASLVGVGPCARLEVALDAGHAAYLQVSDAGDNSVVPGYVLELGLTE